MKLYKRILSLFIVLCVLTAGFSACGTIEKSAKTDTEETNGANQGSTVDREDLLRYTLTKSSLDEFKELLNKNKEKILSSSSCEKALPYWNEIEDALDEILRQSRIAEVLYYCDTTDEEANEQYQYSKEVYADAYLITVDFAVDLFDQGLPFAEELFDGTTEEELKETQRNLVFEKEYLLTNAEITTKFYDMDEDELEDEVHVPYVELITAGNKLAQACGYKNYYDYATDIIYHRDYGPEERETFRQYVIEYVVPLYKESLYAFAESMEDLSNKEIKLLAELAEDTPYDEAKVNYVEKYLSSLSGDPKAGMMHMFENERFITLDSKNALEGAFTTTLDDAFCFFGPDYYQNTYTVIHELGHYYADLCCEEDAEEYSFDLCETHSQGNEMIFTTFLEEELDEDVYETLVNFKLYGMSQTIIIATIVDDFEYQIYSRADYQSLNTEDMNEIMRRVLEKYGMDRIDPEFEDTVQAYWKQVVIPSPVYYISYATSAVTALNIFRMSQEDMESTLKAYESLAKEIDEDKSFINTLKNAGIPIPFETSAFQNLSNLIQD